MDKLSLLTAMVVPIVVLLGWVSPHSFMRVECLYTTPLNYIYSMSIYHVLVIAYVVWGISGFQPQTMVGLDANNLVWANEVSGGIISGSMTNILFAIFLVIIDLLFFLILFFEFPQLNLTPNKIMVIEVLIFSLALFSPGMRMGMMFLSLNSIQITLFYKLMKWIPISKYIFITGGYILLFKILIYPIQFYFRGGA